MGTPCLVKNRLMHAPIAMKALHVICGENAGSSTVPCTYLYVQRRRRGIGVGRLIAGSTHSVSGAGGSNLRGVSSTSSFFGRGGVHPVVTGTGSSEEIVGSCYT